MDIILRDWKVEDLALYKQWNVGHHRWMDFNGPYYQKPSIVEIDQKIDQIRAKISSDHWPKLRERLVIADAVTDRILGTVNWYWQSQETHWMSIGIAIYDETSWGQGLGAKALKHWVDYLFQHAPQIVRLDLRTWSGNLGMIKLAEKLGFQEEARFRQARIVGGQYYDSIAMGVLRSEWGDTTV